MSVKVKDAGTKSPILKMSFFHICVCVFIPSPVRVGTLLMEVPGTPIVFFSNFN